MCYNTPTNTGEAGNVAKARDYKREAETAKARGEKYWSLKVSGKLATDFTAKCAKNGVSKNAVLRRYIERYTYDDFDQ